MCVCVCVCVCLSVCVCVCVCVVLLLLLLLLLLLPNCPDTRGACSPACECRLLESGGDGGGVRARANGDGAIVLESLGSGAALQVGVQHSAAEVSDSAAGSSTATEVVKITDIEVDFDEIEEAEKLIVQELGILIDVRQARQLPVARCARVWIRYRWFSEAALTGDEEAPIFESEPFEKQTTNPELNFRLTHTDVVTAPYLEWLSKEILEIEVWGAVSGDEVGEVGEGGLAVGAATSSGSGAMSGAEAAKTAKTMRMLRSMHEAILRQGIVMTRLSESGGRSDKSYDVCVWIEGGGSSSSGSSSASGTESTELSICISRDGKWSSKKKSGLGPLACCFTKRRVETIPLSTITKLLKGHSTDGFRRSVVRAQPDRCMSIKHASGVVDLQAEDGNVVLFLFETIKKQMPAAVVRRGSAM